MRATKQFFKEALDLSEDALARVTTDEEVSYPRAIREEIGESVLHRTNQYLNMNKIIGGSNNDMDHVKSFISASRFCRAHDELRNYYKVGKRRENVSLKQQLFK